MVAEESSDALRGREEMPTLRKVVDAVNDCLSNSPLVGLPSPSEPLSTINVLKAINRGAHKGGKKGRFWVLDPVDGTLGFVRGDQYAVALALVDRGEVVLGVLGCPNLPLRKEWMRYGHRFYRATEAFFPPEKGLWHKVGLLVVYWWFTGTSNLYNFLHEICDLFRRPRPSVTKSICLEQLVVSIKRFV